MCSSNARIWSWRNPPPRNPLPIKGSKRIATGRKPSTSRRALERWTPSANSLLRHQSMPLGNGSSPSSLNPRSPKTGANERMRCVSSKAFSQTIEPKFPQGKSHKRSKPNPFGDQRGIQTLKIFGYECRIH